MEEKTYYEIKYNDWFTVRMDSEKEPMEELEFDKSAFEAVLADMVLRGKQIQEPVEQTEALWKWVFQQLGEALQNTRLAPQGEQEPLQTLISVVERLNLKQ